MSVGIASGGKSTFWLRSDPASIRSEQLEQSAAESIVGDGSQIVKNRRSKLANLLSLNHYRRRLGAKSLSYELVDLEKLKKTTVEGDEPIQTRGSAKSLKKHLEELRKEFTGQSELVYEHARLIVLLRRGHRESETYQAFHDLWMTEPDFLCDALNIRWLVSAAETFTDFDKELSVRALGLCVSLFANAVKLYESERYITDVENTEINSTKIDILQSELVPLFEGLSCFTVGTDDTLRNARWRIDALAGEHPLGAVLRTVFMRIKDNDTAFARIAALHHRDRTAWW